jgi:hypothetical protein
MKRSIVVLAALAACGALGAATTPGADVVMRVTPPQTHMSLTVEVATQTTLIQGWSFGLCHDATKAKVIDVRAADELNFLLNGGPVGYLAYGIGHGGGATGVFEGVIIGSVDPDHPTGPVSSGPFPDGIPVLHVQYEILQETEVSFCETLGFPPIGVIVVDEGQSIAPAAATGGLLLEPNYDEELEFRVTPAQSDGIITVSLTSPTAAIQGWSFALCHWEDKATVKEARAAADLDVMRNGDPADYVNYDIVPGERRGGVTQAVIIDYSAASYGPYPQGIDLLHVSYQIASETDITFCSGVLGTPPIANTVVIRGDAYTPKTMIGGRLVTGSLSTKFIRGDVSRDGQIDIADAIRICVSATGGGFPSCPDAADVNDNGRIDIADAISLLMYLFQNGRPPASPFPEAGGDLTPGDTLGCAI